MKGVSVYLAAGAIAVSSLISVGFARTISLEMEYLDSPSTNFDRFCLKLISDDPLVPVGAWDGSFSGTFHQVWTSYGDDAFSSPCSGSILDTHYLLSPAIGAVSEDNDLSEDGVSTGWGTFLSGGAMMGNQTDTLPLIQIVVPAGASFNIQGIAADGWGEKYQFDALLSKGDGGVQTIASQLILPTVVETPVSPDPEPVPTPVPPTVPSDSDPAPASQIDVPSFNPSDWTTRYTTDWYGYVQMEVIKIQTQTQMFRCPDCSSQSTFDWADRYDYRSPFYQSERIFWNSDFLSEGIDLTPWEYLAFPAISAPADGMVPEPISLGLFLLGGLGILTRKRGICS